MKVCITVLSSMNLVVLLEILTWMPKHEWILETQRTTLDLELLSQASYDSSSPHYPLIVWAWLSFPHVLQYSFDLFLYHYVAKSIIIYVMLVKCNTGNCGSSSVISSIVREKQHDYHCPSTDIPHNQNYWWASYLAIYSENAIEGILNWRFWLLYGKNSMVII